MYRFYELRFDRIKTVMRSRALTYGNHIHNEFELFYLTEGEQGIIIDGRREMLRAGDCAVIFSLRPHSYTLPPGIPEHNNAAKSLMLFVPSSLIFSVFPEIKGKYPQSYIVRNKDIPDNARLALEKISSESSQNAQIGWALVIFGHLLPKLISDNMETEENYELVSHLLTYIGEHFTEALTLDILAERLNVNKFYISRVFSNKIEMNFRTYIGMLRSQYAAGIIKVSDDDFKKISEKSGFESVRSFYRVFKEMYGMTPAEYRSAIRQDKPPLSGEVSRKA